MFSTPPRGRRLSLQTTPPRSQSSFLLTEANQVKVVVRIRPMNAVEQHQGHKSILFPAIVNSTSSDEDTTAITANETNSDDDDSSSFANTKKVIPKSIFVSSIQRSFEYDAVYGPEVTQEDFFDDSIGSSITQNVLKEGYNTTVMAYGVTGSGKTYTMEGVIARAVKDLFAARDEHIVPKIQLSCLEIYKEDLYDLLDGYVASTPGSNMKLRDHGDRVTVEGLTQRTVASLEQVQGYLRQADAKRTVASTKLNEHSSRSHAITTLTVYNENRVSKVTFVDLAGSERLKATGVQGTSHAKESIHINTDLFVLAKVVHALAAGQKHVPFRDSNLTRFLRDSLGGNCRTTLIACVSPAATNDDTTVATLRYAERARSITNRVKANYDFSDSGILTPAQCITLQEENRSLKTRLQSLLLDNQHPHPAEAKLKLAQEQARQLREQSAAAAQRTRQWMEYLDNDDGTMPKSNEYQQVKQLLKDEQSFGRELLHLMAKVDGDDYSDDYGKNRVQYEINMISQALTDNSNQIRSILKGYSGEDIQAKKVENDYEAKHQMLSEEIAFVNGENDILTQQNKKLQDEIKRLKEQVEEAAAARKLPPTVDGNPRRGLGTKAANLLAWAESAIDNERNMNDSTSSLSSAGTDLKPLARPQNKSGDITNENLVISNMPSVANCPCQDSIFTKNPDYVEFYLPNVRVLCSCGKQTANESIDGDPCSLEHILRTWQVSFLQSVGIQTAEDLIFVANKSTKVLARSMRRWRNENGMMDVKSKSCKVAIHIWARTAKAVTSAVKENRGVRPDFLDVSLSGDERTISTLDVSLSESRLDCIEEC